MNTYEQLNFGEAVAQEISEWRTRVNDWVDGPPEPTLPWWIHPEQVSMMLDDVRG